MQQPVWQPFLEPSFSSWSEEGASRSGCLFRHHRCFGSDMRVLRDLWASDTEAGTGALRQQQPQYHHTQPSVWHFVVVGICSLSAPRFLFSLRPFGASGRVNYACKAAPYISTMRYGLVYRHSVGVSGM